MKLNWFSPGIRRRRMSRGSWHSAQGSRKWGRCWVQVGSSGYDRRHHQMKSRWLQSPVIYFYNQPQSVIWDLEEMGDCYEIPCILGLGYSSCLWLLKDLRHAQEMSQAFLSSSWSQYKHQGQFSPVMWESIQVWAKFSLVILLCGFFPITLFLFWLFPQLALFWSHCFFFFYLLFFFFPFLLLPFPYILSGLYSACF